MNEMSLTLRGRQLTVFVINNKIEPLYSIEICTSYHGFDSSSISDEISSDINEYNENTV